MYPYIKIGPIILWTYGLTGGVAVLCAWRLLEINLRRHDLPQRFAQPIILLLIGSGIVGAKLYAVMEAPARLFADPVTHGGGGSLLALLVLPLYVPVLIMGAGAVEIVHGATAHALVFGIRGGFARAVGHRNDPRPTRAPTRVSWSCAPMVQPSIDL